MLNIYSVQEVARLTGRSERRVQELINEGRVFPRLVIQDGNNKRLGVRKEVLDEILRNGKGRK